MAWHRAPAPRPKIHRSTTPAIGLQQKAPEFAELASDEGDDENEGGRVSLIFGRRRSDNRVMHVGEVDRGLACGCDCCRCGAPLVANQGEIRHHYFAHAADYSQCPHPNESALHLYAKQLIADRLELLLPEVVVSEGERSWSGTPAGVRRYAEAEQEWGFDSYRADVALRAPDENLVVEILYTHRSTDEKVDAIKKAKRAAVEVDVSDLIGRLDQTQAEVDEFILKSAPREWLYCPEWEIGHAELRRQHLLDIHQAAGEQARAFQGYRNKTWRLNQEPELQEACIKYGFRGALHSTTGDATGFYHLHPVALKAKIVIGYILQCETDITVDGIVDWLSSEGGLAKRFVNQPREVLEAMEEYGVPQNGHTLWIERFLQSIEESCPLLREGDGRWLLDVTNAGPLQEELDKQEAERIERFLAEAEKQRLQREAAEAARLVSIRKAHVAAAVRVMAVAAGVADFDVNRWMGETQPRWAASPQAIAESCDPEAWRSFVGAVNELTKAVTNWLPLPDRLDGLPFREGFQHRADLALALLDKVGKAEVTGDVRDRLLWLLSHPLARCDISWFFRCNEELSNLSPIDLAVCHRAGVSRARVAATFHYWRPGARESRGGGAA